MSDERQELERKVLAARLEAARAEAAKTMPAELPPEEDKGFAQRAGEFVLDKFAKPAASAVGAVVEPVNKFMKTYVDPVTSAPLRAALDERQTGGSLPAAGARFGEQFKAGLPSIGEDGVKGGEVLQTTPPGDIIGSRALIGMGMNPTIANTVARPFAGAAVDAIADLTNVIPSGPIIRGAKALVGVAPKAEMAVARTIARMGDRMTGGALNADRALKMYRELKSAEMVFPGSENFGKLSHANEALGRARQAMANASVSVPGSHEMALEIRSMIEAGGDKAMKTPGSAQLLERIEKRAFETVDEVVPARMEIVPDVMGTPVQVQIPESVRSVTKPRDLRLEDIDDIIRDLDSVAYTPLGNSRQLESRWRPFITRSRAVATDALNSVPDGRLFQSMKDRSSALYTAGRDRSKLTEGLSNLAMLQSAGEFVAEGKSSMAPMALVAKFITPSAYVKMLGALKVPSDVARGLKAVKDSGYLKPMADAIEKLARTQPELAERIVRATVLVSGKPVSNQGLEPDELADLAAPRSFEEDDIANEVDRLTNDTSIPSTERAAKLSNIVQRGYVMLPRQPEEPPEMLRRPAPPARMGVDQIHQAMKAVVGG